MSEDLENPRDSSVLAAFEAYSEAFRNGDLPGINEHVHYPLAFIADGTVSIVKEFPLDPNVLRTSKGWANNEGAEIELLASSDTKAHVILRNLRRLRADGSLIEEVNAFYAFTKTAAGWKINAMSGIVIPAT